MLPHSSGVGWGAASQHACPAQARRRWEGVVCAGFTRVGVAQVAVVQIGVSKYLSLISVALGLELWPLMGASALNYEGLIDLLSPWIWVDRVEAGGAGVCRDYIRRSSSIA